MTSRSKITATLLSVLVSSFIYSSSASAAEDNHSRGSFFGYGQPSTTTNLGATLTAGTGAPTGFTGTAKFMFTYNSSNGDGGIHASVALPVDGTITSNTTATTTTYTLTSGSTTCSLAIRDMDFVYSSATLPATPTLVTTTAEYQLSVSVTGAIAPSTTPTISGAIGSCSAVSAPKAGDSVTLNITPVVGTSFTMTGKLAALSNH